MASLLNNVPRRHPDCAAQVDAAPEAPPLSQSHPFAGGSPGPLCLVRETPHRSVSSAQTPDALSPIDVNLPAGQRQYLGNSVVPQAPVLRCERDNVGREPRSIVSPLGCLFSCRSMLPPRAAHGPLGRH